MTVKDLFSDSNNGSKAIFKKDYKGLRNENSEDYKLDEVCKAMFGRGRYNCSVSENIKAKNLLNNPKCILHCEECRKPIC